VKPERAWHYYRVACVAAVRGDKPVFRLAVQSLTTLGAKALARRAAARWKEFNQ